MQSRNTHKHAGTVLCVDRLATNTNRETKRIAESSENTVPACFVYYGDYQASIDIDGELLSGSLPVRQLKMVVGWLALHKEEAYAAWNKAVRGEAFDKIAPLS